MYTAVKLNDRGLYIKNHSEISVDGARYLFSQVAKTPDRGRGGPGFKTGKRTFFSELPRLPAPSQLWAWDIRGMATDEVIIWYFITRTDTVTICSIRR